MGPDLKGPQMKHSASPSMRRVAFASCAGTTIEFYDFYIYGVAAALVFPSVFFPALGPGAGTVASFATLAVAFIARPIGAVLFGHFGDRLGRKTTLITTLLLMGGATVGVGLLPTPETIGVAAPILLVVFRFVQGLAVGGEWAGATLLATEYAPPTKRGLYAVFPQLGPAIALALSNGTFLLANLLVGETSPAFISWGWRVPFLLSGALLVLGLYVRLAIDETPAFRQEKASEAPRKLPLSDAVREHWREILVAGGALTTSFAFFFVGTGFLTSYGSSELGLSRTEVLGLGLPAAAVFGLAVFLSGVYSDRIGRRKVVAGAVLLGIPWSLVLFPLLDTGSPVAFLIGVSGSLAVLGIAYGPAGALLPELFGTRHRYTGAGMAYNLAGVIGGGVTPLLAASFAEAGHVTAIGWLLAGLGVISLLCTLTLPETSGNPVTIAKHPAAASPEARLRSDGPR